MRDIECAACGRIHGDPLGPLAPEASTCNAIYGGHVTQGAANQVVALW